MPDWKKIKKIDGHIHLFPLETIENLPPERRNWWWDGWDISIHRKMMDDNNIERAVILPFNKIRMMSPVLKNIDDAHKNLSLLKNSFPGRYYAFADVYSRLTAAQSCEALERGIREGRLDGLKLHSYNSGIDTADEYNIHLLKTADRLSIPVLIHAYPFRTNDSCSPAKIARLISAFPNLTVIAAHMGAFQWQPLLDTRAYVDISGVLPVYVKRLGIKETNRIMRLFGPDRLIFGTDYPSSYEYRPNQIYDNYYEILGQMDFTSGEAERIAYGNIYTILERSDPRP